MLYFSVYYFVYILFVYIMYVYIIVLYVMLYDYSVAFINVLISLLPLTGVPAVIVILTVAIDTDHYGAQGNM